MKPTSPPIARITPPRITGVVARTRLFDLLDRGMEKSLIWVTAPAGSGKTTMVADWLGTRKIHPLWYRLDAGDADPATFFYYLGLAEARDHPRRKSRLPLLTPEYTLGVETFSRRFFEALGSRYSPRGERRFALVLDDFHQLPERAAIPTLLLSGIGSLPPAAIVIVISRNTPPAELQRWKANNLMTQLGWNEIRFTREETREAVNAMHDGQHGKPECPDADELFEKTDGWAAGLRLMMTATEQQQTSAKYREGARPSPGIAHIAGQDEVNAYFASEVMEGMQPEFRDFLLTTVHLPAMTPSMATSLSGMASSSKILKDITRRNFFTEYLPGREPIYRYHPLFREYLLGQAQQHFDKETLDRVRLHAAELLEREGNPVSAVEILLSLENFDRTIPLIGRTAMSLLAQGRSRTVVGWLTRLPPPIIDASPELLHLAGMAHYATDLGMARGYFERAAYRFAERGAYASALRAGGAFLDALTFEGDSYLPVDPMLERFQEWLGHDRPEVNKAAEGIAGTVLFALAFHNLNHPDLPYWLARAEAAIGTTTETGARLKLCNHLMGYYLFRGEFPSMTRIVRLVVPLRRQVEAVPALYLLCLLMEAFQAAYAAADNRHALDLIDRADELARETGVRIYDFWFNYQAIAIHAYNGRPDLIENRLAALTSQAPQLPRTRLVDLYNLSGITAMARNEWQQAVEWFRQAHALIRETGSGYTEAYIRVHLARTLVEVGGEEESQRLLAALAREQWAHASTIRYPAMITTAWCAWRGGRWEEALSALREGFAVAAEKGMYYQPVVAGAAFSRLCAEALAAGIEPTFIRDLVRKRKMIPADDNVPENWPWPLSIHCLGDFVIRRYDRTIDLTTVQKKPLELLKALIAFGGRDVPEERLQEALWPDAEGDAARVVFKSTLRRLRQVLGDESFVLLKNGRLSLADTLCRIDLFHFMSLAGAERDEDLRWPAALALYRGDFLPDDQAWWSAGMRDKARRLYVRTAAKTVERLVARQRFQKAADYAEQALLYDALDESLYAQLMACYGRLGRRDRVAVVYQRCREALNSHLSIEPSATTERLYRSLTEEHPA